MGRGGQIRPRELKLQLFLKALDLSNKIFNEGVPAAITVLAYFDPALSQETKIRGVVTQVGSMS